MNDGGLFGEGGLLATIAGSLTLLGMGAYRAIRKVKEDVGEDKAAARADRAMDGVLARMEAEISRQNEVIKDVAAKNEELQEKYLRVKADLASAQAGNLLLQGKVQNLERDFAALKVEMADTEAKLAEAEAKLKSSDTGDRRRHTDRIDDRDRRVKE